MTTVVRVPWERTFINGNLLSPYGVMEHEIHRGTGSNCKTIGVEQQNNLVKEKNVSTRI